MAQTQAERKELREQVKRARLLPYEYVECRIQHLWHRVQPLMEPQDPKERVLGWQCQRCLMIRHWIVDTTTGDHRPHYDPPPGYYITRPDDGTRTMSHRALRLEVIHRDDTGNRDVDLPEAQPLHE